MSSIGLPRRAGCIYHAPMKTPTTEILRYDARTISLHWLTVALVTVLWCLGQSIDWFPKGDARIGARSVHITLGVVLAVVLALRVSWRLGAGAQLPLTGPGLMDKAARLAHKLLYVLLILTVLLGLANAWERGDSLFGLFRLPSFAPDDKDLRGNIEDVHAFSANALVILAGLHAAAALFHHYRLKDQVLQRMLRARS